MFGPASRSAEHSNHADQISLMETSNPHRKELTYDDFKKLARDETLSSYEKVGFPKSYREGKEDLIFQDIRRKLCNLDKEVQTIIDIGPGCSGPARMLIEWCRRQRHNLVLVDSEEMLSQLPSAPFVEKFVGRFPTDCDDLLNRYRNRVDVIICYSVLHYIFGETNLFDFLDKSLTLLTDGGEMLIGDIPNVSKRKRLFSSPAGIRFHQQFTGTDEVPHVQFNSIEEGKIDDSVLLALVLRARSAGYDAYLLPQAPELPMANRREDLLIVKP
jgi:hypothetical protein